MERERERDPWKTLNTYVNLIRLYRLILQMEDSTKYASNSYFEIYDRLTEFDYNNKINIGKITRNPLVIRPVFTLSTHNLKLNTLPT